MSQINTRACINSFALIGEEEDTGISKPSAASRYIALGLGIPSPTMPSLSDHFSLSATLIYVHPCGEWSARDFGRLVRGFAQRNVDFPKPTVCAPSRTISVGKRRYHWI